MNSPQARRPQPRRPPHASRRRLRQALPRLARPTCLFAGVEPRPFLPAPVRDLADGRRDGGGAWPCRSGLGWCWATSSACRAACSESREIGVFLKPEVDAVRRPSDWPTQLRERADVAAVDAARRPSRAWRNSAQLSDLAGALDVARRQSACRPCWWCSPTTMARALAADAAGACRKSTWCSTMRVWRQRLSAWLALRRAADAGAGRRCSAWACCWWSAIPCAWRSAARREEIARAAAARRHRWLHPPAVPLPGRMVRTGRRRAGAWPAGRWPRRCCSRPPGGAGRQLWQPLPLARIRICGLASCDRAHCHGCSDGSAPGSPAVII